MCPGAPASAAAHPVHDVVGVQAGHAVRDLLRQRQREPVVDAAVRHRALRGEPAALHGVLVRTCVGIRERLHVERCGRVPFHRLLGAADAARSSDCKRMPGQPPALSPPRPVSLPDGQLQKARKRVRHAAHGMALSTHRRAADSVPHAVRRARSGCRSRSCLTIRAGLTCPAQPPAA